MRVLAVDDDWEILKTLDLCWSDEVEMETVGSGMLAVNKLKKKTYDVVVTDFLMPEMDGIALTKHIREQHPDVMMVMMTAFPDSSLRTEALRAGCAMFISKPFDCTTALERIQVKLSPSDDEA